MSRWTCVVPWAAAVLAIGCTRDVPIGSDTRPRADAAVVVLHADAATSDVSSVCQPVPCQGHIYACGDCLDNDGDGKADMDDADCLGPCQNAEDTFFGAIPGQNHAPCAEDCYFDKDTGLGNDDCLWSHSCDPLSPSGTECPYDPNTKLPKQTDCASAASSQSAKCLSVCGPLTPNGCDCFGCCAIPGASTPVWVGSVDDQGDPSCDHEHVGDPTRCKPCTQVAACLNPCDTCELCVGKTTLPASCQNGSSCSAPACPTGNPCGLDCLSPCPTGQSCVTGCCVEPLE